MASTPLVGLPYPLGTDPPAGAPQMEALARQSEKWFVYRFDSAAQRDSVLSAGIVANGMVAYLRDVDRLTLRKAGNWVTLIDSTMGTSTQADQSGTNETWSSTGGTETPSGGLSTRVQTSIVVPDSGLLLVTVSAQLKVDNNSGSAQVGFRVKTVASENPSGAQIVVDYNINRSVLSESTNFNTGAWTDVVNVGAGRAGQTVYVALVQATSAANRQGTAKSRSLTVIGVR